MAAVPWGWAWMAFSINAGRVGAKSIARWVRRAITGPMATADSASHCPAVLRQALERAAWFSLRQQELWAQGRLHLSVSAQLSEGVREASDQVAEQLIRHVLGSNGFNVAAAARALGLEREQLYYHMKKFGIQRQAPPDPGPGQTA